ncbi:MAG: hypothetical protein HN344_07490, partial [Gammaproteobacteria bacterium]|nr:hypothetical protein [Gammaproteobacteria bacterium]
GAGISVESEEGEGSCFSFSLPLRVEGGVVREERSDNPGMRLLSVEEELLTQLSSDNIDAGLIARLKQEHMEELNEVKRTNDMDTIMVLAESVRRTAESTGCEPLRVWALELAQQASVFNIKMIELLLGRFLDLLNNE